MNNLIFADEVLSPRSLPQALYACRVYAKGYYDCHRERRMSLLLQNLIDAVTIVLTNPRTPVCDMEAILARFVEALDHDPASAWPLIQSVLEDARRLLGLPGVVMSEQAGKSESAIARQLHLLTAFKPFHGVVHQACEDCGSILWAEVAGGYRCLHCMPPRTLPDRLRTALEEVLP